MQLEINKEHKKADLTKKKLRRLFRGSALGLTILATVYSGASKAQAAELENGTPTITSEQNNYNDNIINIPEKFSYDIHYDVEKEQEEPITTTDLQKIDYLFLSVEDGDDLSWLQYCTNIRELIINFKTDNIPDFSFLQSLNNLESFSVSCFPNVYNDFSNEKFSFLHQCQSVKNLYILGFENIEPGFLESLTNLDKITLSDCTNQNLDYSKLTFLKELDFSNTDPYDLPVFFTNEEYNILKSNGVNVTSSNNIERSLEIGNRLDNIVNSLGITDSDTEQQKLDKILIYVLENLEYDEAVSQALLNNEEHTDLTKSFYTEGNLYGALEKDSAICGNYSALVSALCKRVGIDNYFLISNNHAWNLVDIDGTDYYVDATWLDDISIAKSKENATYDEYGNMTSMEITFENTPAVEFIKEGKTDNLDWYLENPNNISQIDQKESHEVVNLPAFIEIREISDPETEIKEMQEEYEQMTEGHSTEEVQTEKETQTQTEKVEEFKKKKFEVKIDKKVFIISGAALLGLLGGLGVGITIHHHNKKKRERERRRREQLYNDLYGFNDTPDFSPYRRHR